MSITFEGTIAILVEMLIGISCIYTSLALITSAIEHIKNFIKKNKGGINHDSR